MSEELLGLEGLPVFGKNPCHHHKKNYFDVYEIARITGQFCREENLNQDIRGVVGVSRDSKKLYITNTDYEPWVIKKSKLKANRSSVISVVKERIKKYEIVIPNSQLIDETYQRRF